MSLKKSNNNNWPFLSSFFDNDWLKNEFTQENWLPAINVVSNNGNYEVELATPGFKKDEVHISIENKTLTIEGESKSEKEQEDKNYTRKEFSSSSFVRSFTLPEDVVEDSIDAKYTDGVLRISLKKSEKAAKNKKEVAIK